MLIGGFQKFSMIDYPEKLSAVVFSQGCNFICPYCHNPELNSFNTEFTLIEEKEILAFLKTRIGKIDAVVISGGEPTFQIDLIDFIEEIKAFGFLIKLDTNGACPDVIEVLLNRKLIDYIAMDIKTTSEKYSQFSKNILNFNNIKKSINLILQGNINYEFRTTVLRELLSCDDILEIGQLIKGAKKFYLQKFVPTKLLDEACYQFKTYNEQEFLYLKQELEKYIEIVRIR